MAHYADTSFLASYYLPDANSARALAAIQTLSAPFVFTALHRLELRNALALAVFRGRVTSPQVQSVWQDVTMDFRAGLLSATRLNWYAVFRAAAILSLQHTASTGCRSLYILHIAAARKLAATEIFSFDPRQRALAQVLGINGRP